MPYYAVVTLLAVVGLITLVASTFWAYRCGRRDERENDAAAVARRAVLHNPHNRIQ